MTPDELDAIEARANAATPGPWKCWNGWPFRPPMTAMARIGPEGPTAGLMGSPDGRSADLYANESDAEFVAWARTDVPALVADVRRLREAMAEISEGKGRFSLDHHEHACNTIDDMKALAVAALAGHGAVP